jgi:hypothetical protein
MTRICLLLVLALAMASCGRSHRPHQVMANEELRLTPEQVRVDEEAAQHGDAAAAKKLWHHYTFAVGDLKKGQMWKDAYDKLSSEQH